MSVEDKKMLAEAMEEIKELRRQSVLLRARLKMFDDMMALFTADRPTEQYYHQSDILFRIEDRINEKKQ